MITLKKLNNEYLLVFEKFWIFSHREKLKLIKIDNVIDSWRVAHRLDHVNP